METFEPAYLSLHRQGLLKQRAETALELLSDCRLCPRDCGINRLEGKTGFCKTGYRAKVADFHSHFGEEAPLSGRGGSGTIFLSSCNLLCSFCQNDEISHGNAGREVTAEGLAEMMISLERRGCHNINFVSPTHVAPQIIAGVNRAAEMGLTSPLVYNTGGYDLPETISLLEGIFDIYMPDFKFWDNAWAKHFCRAPDYRERAQGAILKMHRQVGDLITDRRGIARRGLLVRHLVLPNDVAGTREIMEFLAQRVSQNTYVNIMDQYRPCAQAWEEPAISRRISAGEYAAALKAAREAGLTRLEGLPRG